jgi:hypothetical protein
LATIAEALAAETETVKVAVVVPLFPSVTLTSLIDRPGSPCEDGKSPTFSRLPVAVVAESEAVGIPWLRMAARISAAVAPGFIDL